MEQDIRIFTSLLNSESAKLNCHLRHIECTSIFRILQSEFSKNIKFPINLQLFLRTTYVLLMFSVVRNFLCVMRNSFLVSNLVTCPHDHWLSTPITVEPLDTQPLDRRAPAFQFITSVIPTCELYWRQCLDSDVWPGGEVDKMRRHFIKAILFGIGTTKWCPCGVYVQL